MVDRGDRAGGSSRRPDASSTRGSGPVNDEGRRAQLRGRRGDSRPTGSQSWWTERISYETSSLADFIFVHSGSLNVSVAVPSGCEAKVQMSEG